MRRYSGGAYLYRRHCTGRRTTRTQAVLGPPVFISATAATSGTPAVGSFQVNAPASIVQGNQLLAFVYGYTGASAPTLTPPSGWTLITAMTVADTVSRMSVYAKTATGSEPATYTWTSTPNTAWMVGVTQYGVPALGVDGQAISAAVGTVTWATPTFTSGHAVDTLVFGIAQAGTQLPPGTPAGATLRASHTTNGIGSDIRIYDAPSVSMAVGAFSGATGTGNNRCPAAVVALN